MSHGLGHGLGNPCIRPCNASVQQKEISDQDTDGDTVWADRVINRVIPIFSTNTFSTHFRQVQIKDTVLNTVYPIRVVNRVMQQFSNYTSFQISINKTEFHIIQLYV